MIERHVATRPVSFPYVPGLLSFREVPALLVVIRRLRLTPDVFIADGQGLAHPRRFGLASHLGVVLDHPTVGCAKSRLAGTFAEPGPERGSWTELKENGKTIGAVLRTRTGVRPLFVSVGHRIDLRCALDVVQSCGLGMRLPEPTRLADRLVGLHRKAIAMRV